MKIYVSIVLSASKAIHPSGTPLVIHLGGFSQHFQIDTDDLTTVGKAINAIGGAVEKLEEMGAKRREL